MELPVLDCRDAEADELTVVNKLRVGHTAALAVPDEEHAAGMLVRGDIYRVDNPSVLTPLSDELPPWSPVASPDAMSAPEIRAIRGKWLLVFLDAARLAGAAMQEREPCRDRGIERLQDEVSVPGLVGLGLGLVGEAHLGSRS